MGRNIESTENVGYVNERREVRVQIKRVYDPKMRGDGLRILVDRLWPRGVRKDEAQLYRWARELAPQYGVAPMVQPRAEAMATVCAPHRKELSQRAAQLEALRILARRRSITLLYAARNREQNEAVILKRALEFL